jgi:hypothetical protein
MPTDSEQSARSVPVPDCFVFAPKKGAVFTVDPAGYGAQGRDGADASMYHAAVRKLVDAVDLPHDVKQFICLKRQVPYG